MRAIIACAARYARIPRFWVGCRQPFPCRIREGLPVIQAQSLRRQGDYGSFLPICSGSRIVK